MALPFYNWSRVAASNASADATINWAEGQAPSSVNDSGRAMMASTAAFRDDISGAIATGGTSTAYTVTSYQIFDTLAHMNAAMIAFTPHATNGATVTLNVDGLGAKPLRSSPSVELLAGTIIQGTPYVATYNNSDACWYLQNFFGNPYNVPLGGMMDYIGSSAPNASFVLPFGQAISRTTYATLFSLISTTYGVGDGSTTFNVPDGRGRVIAGCDNMGGSAASRLTSASGMGTGLLGQVGGAETQTLVAAQIPSLTSVNASQSISVGSATYNMATTNGGISADFFNSGSQRNAAFSGGVWAGVSGLLTANNSISVAYTNASQTATRTLQPTIVLNKILRII